MNSRILFTTRNTLALMLPPALIGSPCLGAGAPKPLFQPKIIIITGDDINHATAATTTPIQ